MVKGEGGRRTRTERVDGERGRRGWTENEDGARQRRAFSHIAAWTSKLLDVQVSWDTQLCCFTWILRSVRCVLSYFFKIYVYSIWSASDRSWDENYSSLREFLFLELLGFEGSVDCSGFDWIFVGCDASITADLYPCSSSGDCIFGLFLMLFEWLE